MTSQPQSSRAALRFVVPATLGLAFFMLPVPSSERITVPFDIAVGWIIRQAPTLVGVYCLLLITIGAVATSYSATSSTHAHWWKRFSTSKPMLLVRLLAVPLALAYVFQVGPDFLLQDGVRGLMWSTLAFSVGVIIPIGAALLVLLVRYGFLEFVGTVMRPIMRPLFRLPGRSALDSITSWVGSYSVGLYLTRSLTLDGYYNRREAYTIATCFSTVSIGFVAVVAQTLDLLHLFPLIFICYFVAIYALAAILARVWPITAVSTEYLGQPQPEPAASANLRELLREGWNRALDQANTAGSLLRAMRVGIVDGLVLASTILGSILAIGTAALLLARETSLFAWLGRPIVPVLSLLGLPDAELIAPATLVGITEMYIPALLVREAAVPARFFIAVLSVSQLIFFSAIAPMVIDMFRDVPIRARELVALFLMRTAILIPLLAALTAILSGAGVLAE
ncbi:MAG: YjiH family protein [Gemmatimonadota bacterium]|nr:MAG: YjiH family protein [Gemmatimonadota bacterium]